MLIPRLDIHFLVVINFYFSGDFGVKVKSIKADIQLS